MVRGNKIIELFKAQSFKFIDSENERKIGFRQCRNQDFWVGGAKKPFSVTNEYNCIKIDKKAIFVLQ
jgi:hypothetical protein